MFDALAHRIIRTLFLIGFSSLTIGILVIIYPDLLGILVGILLIIVGLEFFSFGFSVRHYASYLTRKKK